GRYAGAPRARRGTLYQGIIEVRGGSETGKRQAEKARGGGVVRWCSSHHLTTPPPHYPVRSEDERDAGVEAVEGAEDAVPRRVEAAEVERHRVARGDRVEERHEVVAEPQLDAVGRVPPHVDAAGQFRHDGVLRARALDLRPELQAGLVAGPL